MNKNTLSLALLLSTVSANDGTFSANDGTFSANGGTFSANDGTFSANGGTVELGLHLGLGWISSSGSVTPHWIGKDRKDNATDSWTQNKTWAIGGARRLSLGYIKPIRNGVFAGIHTFFGVGNGEYSIRSQNGEATKWKGTFSVKQSWNTGVYGQIGTEHDNHRFFGIAGYTLSKFYVSSQFSVASHASSAVKEIAMDNGTVFTGSKSQWRNGLSLGAGYAYKVSPRLQMGLTYIATWFPGKFPSTATLATIAKEQLGKIKDRTNEDVKFIKSIDKITTSTRSVSNHFIFLSISLNLNKNDASQKMPSE